MCVAAGVRCGDAKGYTEIATLGFDCETAKDFLVKGDNRWVTIPSIATKVGKYLCNRVKAAKNYLQLQCINKGRSILFRVPTA